MAHDMATLTNHIRVIHPDAYGDGPQYWPDGGLVIIEDEIPQ